MSKAEKTDFNDFENKNPEIEFLNNLNNSQNMDFQTNNTFNNFSIVQNDIYSSFSSLKQSFQSFCNNNFQNILTLFSNVSQVINMIIPLIKNQNNSNNKNNNSKIDYLLFLSNDLKKQIITIQYYYKLQKFFTSYIMKNIELFIEQVYTSNYFNVNNSINQLNLNNSFNLNPFQFSNISNNNFNFHSNYNNFQNPSYLNCKKDCYVDEQKFFDKMKKDIKKNLKNYSQKKRNCGNNIFKINSPIFVVNQKNENTSFSSKKNE